MGLRRGVRRNLVLLIATLSDVYGEVAMSTFRKRLWWPGYNPPSVMQAVSRMVKVGDLAREMRKDGELVLRLQAKGGRLLDEAIPLRKFQEKRWDGKWRLVVFDIPEKQRSNRDALRVKLRALGFGKWQKSVYVTPHDIMREVNEYLEGQVLFPLVVCFESWRTGFGDDREFADEIFQTEKLNGRYKGLIDDVVEVERLLGEDNLTSHELEQRCRDFWMRYIEIIESDPFLPFELLPKSWNAHEAKVVLRRLTSRMK